MVTYDFDRFQSNKKKCRNHGNCLKFSLCGSYKKQDRVSKVRHTPATHRDAMPSLIYPSVSSPEVSPPRSLYLAWRIAVSFPLASSNCLSIRKTSDLKKTHQWVFPHKNSCLNSTLFLPGIDFLCDSADHPFIQNEATFLLHALGLLRGAH